MNINRRNPNLGRDDVFGVMHKVLEGLEEKNEEEEELKIIILLEFPLLFFMLSVYYTLFSFLIMF